MRTYYKFRFYLNARHSVTFKGKTSSIHPHTWEIALSFGIEESDIINFTTFENVLEKYFENFEGKYLNEHPLFENTDPTMENIVTVLYREIKDFLKNNNFKFRSIEISENPTRTYGIEEE